MIKIREDIELLKAELIQYDTGGVTRDTRFERLSEFNNRHNLDLYKTFHLLMTAALNEKEEDIKVEIADLVNAPSQAISKYAKLPSNI